MPLSTDKIAYYYRSAKELKTIEAHEVLLEMLLLSLSYSESLLYAKLVEAGDKGLTAKEAARKTYIAYTTANGAFNKFVRYGIATVQTENIQGTKRTIHGRWYAPGYMADWYKNRFGEILE